MVRMIVLISALFLSQSAWAVFDIQGYAGKRTVDSLNGGNSEFSGLNYGAAFHFSPLPFVPVAIGMAAEYITYDDFSIYDDVTGYLVIPQVYVWVPIGLLSVNPFVKLGYAFGALTAEGHSGGQSYKGAFKLSGTHMTGGVKWEPPVIPFLSIFFQYDFGFEKSSVASIKQGGTKIDIDGPDEDFKNTAWQLGIEFKI